MPADEEHKKNRPKPLIKYGKTDYDSKTHELWQKIAVVNDYIAKKAEKSGKTAKFGVKIVHNRKKVTKNSSLTGTGKRISCIAENEDENEGAFSVGSNRPRCVGSGGSQTRTRADVAGQKKCLQKARGMIYNKKCMGFK